MVDQIRFFAGAARVLEGRSAGRVHGRAHLLRAARADRRLRPGDPVELPDDDGRLEVRAGPRGRQHGRAQAVRHDAGVDPAARRDRRRVPAAGRAQRGLRRPRHRPRPGRPTPRPQLVSITGSTRAGKEVAAAAAPDLKRTHLELGGKAPVVVFDDADIAAAAEAIAVAGYFNAGQDCTAATRVLAGPGIHDDFVAALTEQARGTKTGAPDDEDVLYGPLNNANQLARVSGFVERLPDHASLQTGRRAGRRPGLLLRADRRRRPAPGRRDHPGRGVRPGHHRAALHRRGRGGALGQRRPVRPGLLGLDPRPRPGDAGVAPARLRLRLGQHPHPARRRDAARRLQALRLRQGPVDVRPGGLHPGQARDAQHRRRDRHVRRRKNCTSGAAAAVSRGVEQRPRSYVDHAVRRHADRCGRS